MKIKHIDKLQKGDILVVTSTKNFKSLRYKIGDQLLYDSAHIAEPMSASTLYLRDNNKILAFTINSCVNFTPLSVLREKSINNILDIIIS